jgi:hypothetical protein
MDLARFLFSHLIVTKALQARESKKYLPRDDFIKRNEILSHLD